MFYEDIARCQVDIGADFQALAPTSARVALLAQTRTAGLATTGHRLLLALPDDAGSAMPAVGIELSGNAPIDVPPPLQTLALPNGPALRWREPKPAPNGTAHSGAVTASRPAALPAYLATHLLTLSGAPMLGLPATDAPGAPSAQEREWLIPVTHAAEPSP